MVSEPSSQKPLIAPDATDLEGALQRLVPVPGLDLVTGVVPRDDLVGASDGAFLQRDQRVQHLECGCGGERLLRAGFVVNVALAGFSRFDHQCSVHASLVEQPGDIGIFRMSEAGKAEEQKREKQLRH